MEKSIKRWMLYFLQYVSIALIFALFFGSACSQDQVQTQSGTVKVENLASGLNHPWGMAFLPDGRLLVTERSGDLRILNKDNSLTDPLKGVPEVFAKGQGGLLDVALDPEFSDNKYVYLSFAEPGGNNTASTAVGRGKLEGNEIINFEVLFRQEPKVDGENHFGGRIVFDTDHSFFLTMGERFKFDPAQDLTNHLGTIVHINKDGTVPENNPFVNDDTARDEIWSYGHRNIEGADIDPATGKPWIVEMGPKGGDELNQPVKAENYGWPVVSWGENYDGTDIPDPPTKPGFTDALIHWTPVISPSGLKFYTGDMFPQWKGSALIGGLTSKGIVRVSIDGDQAKEMERIDLGARIRDVEQAPDGAVYVLTDQGNGNVWKITMGK